MTENGGYGWRDIGGERVKPHSNRVIRSAGPSNREIWVGPPELDKSELSWSPFPAIGTGDVAAMANAVPHRLGARVRVSDMTGVHRQVAVPAGARSGPIHPYRPVHWMLSHEGCRMRGNGRESSLVAIAPHTGIRTVAVAPAPAAPAGPFLQ